MSAVRLCAAAAARQPAAHRSGRWHQLLRQPRAARQAAAVRRRYHVAAPGPYAIATPFPGAPALQEAAPKPWVRAVPAAAPGALQRRLGDLWQLYLQSLARRPLLTKAATSFVCVLIGDSIAQCIGGARRAAAAGGGQRAGCALHRAPEWRPCTHAVPSAAPQARPTAWCACCAWRPIPAPWAPSRGTTGEGGRRQARPHSLVPAVQRLPPSAAT